MPRFYSRIQPAIIQALDKTIKLVSKIEQSAVDYDEAVDGQDLAVVEQELPYKANVHAKQVNAIWTASSVLIAEMEKNLAELKEHHDEIEKLRKIVNNESAIIADPAMVIGKLQDSLVDDPNKTWI